jgi:hypothetical protein
MGGGIVMKETGGSVEAVGISVEDEDSVEVMSGGVKLVEGSLLDIVAEVGVVFTSSVVVKAGGGIVYVDNVS